MALPKFSASALSLAGVVLLVGGLGVAILGTQQRNDTRSHAMIPADSTTQTCIQNGGQCAYNGCPAGTSSMPGSCGSGYMACCTKSGTGSGGSSTVTDAQVDTVLMASCIYRGGTCSSSNSCSSGTALGTCNKAETHACCMPGGGGSSSGGGGSSSSGGGDWTGGQCGDHGCCNNQATVRQKTGWSSAPAGSCHDKRVYSCPNNRWVPSNVWLCPGDDNIVCCVPPDPAAPAPAGDTQAPSAPALTATVSSANPTSEIDLSWTAATDNVGVTGYDIMRDNENTPLATVTKTTFQDKNLIPETSHAYIVIAHDAAGNKTNSNPASATTQAVPLGDTIFTLNLFLHGIGKGGDNRNKHGDGNLDPFHHDRNVTVNVFDPTQPITPNTTPLLSKTGIASYDPQSGSFKIQDLDMGTTLTTNTYKIVALTQTLRGSVTTQITAGATVPLTMTLVNGDMNSDGQLDIVDYNQVQACVSDFGIIPSEQDCPADQKKRADLDDDGSVTIFDTNLIIREMSVQSL